MLSIVEEIRDQLRTGREEIRAEHDGGASGRQVTSLIADLADKLLLELIHESLDHVTDGAREKLESRMALVPHGGYGRRDLAPYSDLDLMLLYRPDAMADIEPFAQRLSQNIVDAGFDLGFSTRTPSDAVNLSLKDVKIYTSLVESRYLAGSVGIYSKFLSRLARQAQRRPLALVRSIETARIEERNKHGETNFYLRPNIKKTRGGLRDIQLVRWIGFTKFGQSDLDALFRSGAIHEFDFENLTAAHRFLLSLRNEMHFHAGKARDVLGMSEQVRIAELWGYGSDRGVLPVEQFMRDYFDHTSLVGYAADHVVASAKSRFHISDWISPWFSQNEEGYFRIGPLHISTTRKGLEYVVDNLEGVLHLMSLANLHDKRIDHHTWKQIRESMTSNDELEVNSTVAWRFCSFMSDSNRLGDLLRRLHEMRVLEKIVPAYRHIRCLVQFNEYHKYTVDEHSIRAVEAATRYTERDDILGHCYNSIKDKKVLHLALLLHDAGKGFEEDHSEVGARIAAETATLLNLTQRETEDLVFLVRHHLMMSHLAMRRDTSDLSLVAGFAKDVGSTDMLKMLYVLTCADLEAVGPDTLNEWKFNLISRLYFLSLKQLSSSSATDLPEFDLGEIKKGYIRQLTSEGRSKLAEIARKIPADMYEVWGEERLDEFIGQLQTLDADDLLIDSTRNSHESAFEYAIAKMDRPYSAVFHRITGALTSQHLEILSVDIIRPEIGKILYRFHVIDQNVTTETVEKRMEQVRDVIVETLSNEDARPKFGKVWGETDGPSTIESTLPSRVSIDNNSARRATVIDVFTHDKPGLLYTITQTLHDLGLQISAAKIGTYLDQVVDVFYVNDRHGKKIRDLRRIQRIRSTLLKRISEA